MATRSRRSFLATVAGGGLVGVAGCLDGNGSVSVLAAGSLAVVLEDHVGPQFSEAHDTAYQGAYHGSNAVMRMIEDKQKNPDVAVSADSGLLRDRLYGQGTDWDVAFASNSVGLAYASDTSLGERLDTGDPWYEVVLAAEEGAVAISDPDLDPLGYRAMHAFQLAQREHDLEGFAETVADLVYREPQEPQLLAGVETGNRAAAVAYRNMATERDLQFQEFPDAYNFSDPEMADHYATVSYTTDEGYTATGRPVVYNATVIDSADNPDAGLAFVGFLTTAGTLLAENGLTVDGFPKTYGDPPSEVSPS